MSSARRADEYRELDAERILVLLNWVGRDNTCGLELEQMKAKRASLFHIRDGRVTRLVAYFDRECALADLGLVTETGSTRS
jgi:ketosteroid isomerase-like protein